MSPEKGRSRDSGKREFTPLYDKSEVCFDTIPTLSLSGGFGQRQEPTKTPRWVLQYYLLLYLCSGFIYAFDYTDVQVQVLNAVIVHST